MSYSLNRLAISLACIIGISGGILTYSPVAHAGLFESLDLKSPTPEPFDFTQVKSDPATLLPNYLDVSSKGSGISKLKKVVIALLEVRFRKDLGAEATAENFVGTSVDLQLKNDTALYQRLTDDLYTNLVKELTSRGIEVVDVSVLNSQPEYQEGRKAAKPSGREENLKSVSRVRDQVGDEKADKGFFSQISKGIGGEPYFVYYASKTPGLQYTGFASEGTGLTEPLTQHPIKLMRAAENAGVDVITVGFEVRMSKFARESTNGPFSNSAKVAVTPMMRTQLLAMRVMSSEGGNSAFPPNTGIQIEPHNRGTKRGGLMGALTNGAATGYAWIELDGNGVISSDSAKGVSPIPGGFEPAFEKCMNAQLRLLMAAIDSKRNK